MKLAKRIAAAVLALSLCAGLSVSAFAANNVVELHADGGILGQYTVELTGVLSQKEYTLQWKSMSGGQTISEESHTGTAYTVDLETFTFSESTVNSENHINDYTDSTTLYGLTGLRKSGSGWIGDILEGKGEYPFPDYRLILEPENATKYDMFYLSSGAGEFFVILNEKPSQGGNTPFADVASDAYYCQAVQWAVEKGITTGTSATTFSPDSTCTTAQILTFLWRANGSPEPTKAATFTDVSADAYYAKAAAWAAEKGLVSGTTFGGDTPCTRMATVTYLWKLAGQPSLSATAAFTDLPNDVSAQKAVSWAVEQGITTGTGATTFSPNGICTRGQIVTFLHRDLAK